MGRNRAASQGRPFDVNFTDDDGPVPLFGALTLGILIGLICGLFALVAGYGVAAAIGLYVLSGTLATFLIPLVPLMAEWILRTARRVDSPAVGASRLGSLECGSGVEVRASLPCGARHRYQRWVDLTSLPREPRVLFVCNVPRDARYIGEVLGGQGFDVDLRCSFSAAMLAVIEAPTKWQLLCVDLDVAGEDMDLEVIVERLHLLRRTVPTIPVVILSSAFSRHDDDLHRAPVADVSLRLPVSEGDLLAGIEVAFENNAIWRRRSGEGN